jgi:hypothetical protein
MHPAWLQCISDDKLVLWIYVRLAYSIYGFNLRYLKFSFVLFVGTSTCFMLGYTGDVTHDLNEAAKIRDSKLVKH